MLYVEPDEQDEHFYRNAQADELVYVVEGEGDARVGVRRSAVPARATTSSSTAASCTATCSTRRRAAQAAGLREPRARPFAQAIPQRVRPAEGGCAVLRARHPPPVEARHARRDGRFPAAREAVRRHQRVDPRPPSVRRRRLGRILLSVGVQHPRLRADRRPRPPAAAGAPDVRGRRIRRLLVLPAAVRLRSRTRCRRRTTTATSTPTRCCTTRRASS